jgi:ubiquitin-protein ligase
LKEGIYKNAKIKFILDFPSTFPTLQPELKLLTKIYHPLVSEDGKVDILSIIPVWNYGEKCQVFDLLMKFKKIFGELSYLRNRDSFNPDAAIL